MAFQFILSATTSCENSSSPALFIITPPLQRFILFTYSLKLVKFINIEKLYSYRGNKMTKFNVIYDPQRSEEFFELIEPALKNLNVECLAYDSSLSLSAGAPVICWVGDKILYDLLPIAKEAQCPIGLLPHPELKLAKSHFYIDDNIEKALENITQNLTKPTPIDLMYFNDQLVFGSVMLGHAQTMRPVTDTEKRFWLKLWYFLSAIFTLSHLRLLPFSINTAKEQLIQTAAMGITVVYRLKGSEFTRHTFKTSEADESALNMVILAPRSISQLIGFLLLRTFSRQRYDQSLPEYLGLIKSESFTIESTEKIPAWVDGETSEHETITLRTVEDGLLLLNHPMPEKVPSKNLKESVRIQDLPSGQVVKELNNQTLPWIHHTDIEEVKETFIALKDNSQASQSFIVLMILSTLLATVGLFANSAPVIIGAMILAPLMAPIVSLSMGILRQNTELLFTSIKTLGIGISLAIMCGMLITTITPLSIANSEISARLSPSILDLAVAIISGIAAAYAHSRSEVMQSLAGVAIAVALVPPLAVTGIGIGWLDWSVFYGAFLLFITNLTGIALAAAVTFLIMGYSPFHLAKKGVAIVLLIVTIISIPLVKSFETMVKQQQVVTLLEGKTFEQIKLKKVQVIKTEPLHIAVQLISDKPLTEQNIDQIKQHLQKELNQPFKLEATFAVIR